MRTTIDLPDSLAEAVMARASAEGRTSASVVEEALLAVLEGGQVRADDVQLSSFGSPEGRLLVEPSRSEAVWAVLDADGPRWFCSTSTPWCTPTSPRRSATTSTQSGCGRSWLDR